MIVAILFYGITGAVLVFGFAFLIGLCFTDFDVREATSGALVIVAIALGAAIIGCAIAYGLPWLGHHVVGVPADLNAWKAG